MLVYLMTRYINLMQTKQYSEHYMQFGIWLEAI